ncbi:hypothetical protein IMZ48_03340 [Candidatus Bathyarchaeota archaeon]|nr:hypothetical protein [Candidatus Bathyarchaeota archaeon]
MCVFIATRIFDVALTSAAATAATVAGAHAAGVSLTPAMLQTAAVGGAIKAGAMAFAGIVMLGPVSTPLLVLPLLLATSLGTNVLLVAAVGNRVLGHGEPPTSSRSPFFPFVFFFFVWMSLLSVLSGKNELKLSSMLAPSGLLAAAAVASIPLSFCLIYYYGGKCRFALR